MRVVSNDQLIGQLKWRYATKVFDPERKIPDADWQTLVDALVLTPSSYGLQPWKFVVVSDPALRAQLPAYSWGQRQVVDASHLVVFATRKKISMTDVDSYLARIREVRGGSSEAQAGFRKMLQAHVDSPPMPLEHWAALQAYIALGNFMTAAAMLGIDTCPMEGFEPPKYDEALGLSTQGLTATVLCAAGYRAAGDKYAEIPKVRMKPEDAVAYI